MKITEDARKYAAEQGIAEEEALKKGMEEKSREFRAKGSDVLDPQPRGRLRVDGSTIPFDTQR